ncbi:hypothetical protein AB0B10_25180 [Micromonospora arborensis]|uniref:hypothetical protein n=1 Tax=Micromonospora arborensis TaxID=2116518 RepID=UPI0033D4F300
MSKDSERHCGAGTPLMHLVDGFLPIGGRVRATCSCGHTTTPRVDETRALAALRADHELSPPICALCGHDYTGRSWYQLRTVDLRILTDSTNGQFLACRDLPTSCLDGAAQRQMHLDRAAFEGFGLPVPAPRLRVIPGGGQ